MQIFGLRFSNRIRDRPASPPSPWDLHHNAGDGATGCVAAAADDRPSSGNRYHTSTLPTDPKTPQDFLIVREHPSPLLHGSAHPLKGTRRITIRPTCRPRVRGSNPPRRRAPAG